MSEEFAAWLLEAAGEHALENNGEQAYSMALAASYWFAVQGGHVKAAEAAKRALEMYPRERHNRLYSGFADRVNAAVEALEKKPGAITRALSELDMRRLHSRQQLHNQIKRLLEGDVPSMKARNDIAGFFSHHKIDFIDARRANGRVADWRKASELWQQADEIAAAARIAVESMTLDASVRTRVALAKGRVRLAKITLRCARDLSASRVLKQAIVQALPEELEYKLTSRHDLKMTAVLIRPRARA